MPRIKATSNGVEFNPDDAIYELLQGLKTDTDGGVSIEIIDILHQLVHDGKLHAISTRKSDVDGNGTFTMIIEASEDKDVHLRLNYGGEFKTGLQSFLNPTYTGGDLYVPFNRQTTLTNNLLSVYKTDATITNNGTARGNEFIGSGGRFSAVGGGTSNDLETVINAGDTLLIVLTNEDTTDSDLQITAAVYEREPFV